MLLYEFSAKLWMHTKPRAKCPIVYHSNLLGYNMMAWRKPSDWHQRAPVNTLACRMALRAHVMASIKENNKFIHYDTFHTLCTGFCCTLAISRGHSLQIPHESQPQLAGRACYGCLLLVRNLTEVLPTNLLHCVQYHVILYRDISRVYSTYFTSWLCSQFTVNRVIYWSIHVRVMPLATG